MFAHFPYIAKHHHVALESAIRNHSVISGISAALLVNLYKLSLEGLDKPIQEDGFFTSSLRAGNVTLSSATDGKTGIWIQLAKVEGQTNFYLTIGQKWAMESLVPALGNTSTLFW